MLKYIGRLAGVFGLLKLIQDLKLVSLQGLFKDWLDAYSVFLKFVKEYVLFLKWMRDGIQESELNILILGCIFAASVIRAMISFKESIDPVKWKEEALPSMFAHIFIYVALPYLVSRFLQPILSIAISGITILLFFSVHLFAGYDSEDEKVQYPETALVRREFFSVIIYTLIIVAASYILF